MASTNATTPAAPKQKSTLSVVCGFLEGSTAASIGTVFSNPAETVKTRLMLQGELQRRGAYEPKYRGFFHGSITVLREEGIRGLQQGLETAILHQFAFNGARLGGYPHILATVKGLQLPGATPFAESLIAGAFCGAFAMGATSPLYLIKTRLQAQMNAEEAAHLAHTKVIGQQHNYKGFFDALKQIFLKGGIKGLYQGASAGMQRMALGSATQLATYDTGKRLAQNHSIGQGDADIRVHICAAIVASASVAGAMNPLDVVFTRRLNNDHSKSHSGGQGQRKTFLVQDAAAIFKTEGVSGLYKGTVPLFMRQVPHTVATFICLEQFKKWHATYLD